MLIFFTFQIVSRYCLIKVQMDQKESHIHSIPSFVDKEVHSLNSVAFHAFQGSGIRLVTSSVANGLPSYSFWMSSFLFFSRSSAALSFPTCFQLWYEEGPYVSTSGAIDNSN